MPIRTVRTPTTPWPSRNTKSGSCRNGRNFRASPHDHCSARTLPTRWRPRMNADPSRKRKMSEMISEMAATFISGGKTPEEKHHRLTAVCSAWNMACGSPDIRRKQLEQYVEGYRQNNPAISPGDLANVRKVMESLMERKLEMFPDDKRQIVSAKIVMVGSAYRIETESAKL